MTVPATIHVRLEAAQRAAIGRILAETRGSVSAAVRLLIDAGARGVTAAVIRSSGYREGVLQGRRVAIEAIDRAVQPILRRG